MINIKTYSELDRFLSAFARGKINLLIIESAGGLSKSFSAAALLGEAAHFIKGHATPLSIYLALFRENPELLVFDDVETLLENQRNTTLLKQICESTDVKTVNYLTTAKINDEAVPPSIAVRSKTLILCNHLRRKGLNLSALLSRAIHVRFRPSRAEIMKKLESFAKDSEVFQEILDLSGKAAGLNLRLYTKSLELKASGMDWKKYLVEMALGDAKAQAYYEVERLHRRLSVGDRAKRFAEATGKSERTYYNVKKRLEEKNGIDNRR